jgi:ATP-dependent helicase HrpA
LAPGICVRLYSEEDFAARPAFTQPEILRTGLAGVLLRLEALRLGPIDEFPFIDAPPKKAVADAYQLLHLLGAIDDERRLTKDGELMARLPVDPRVARLLVVSNRNDALREGLVIAAALSVVDPREYGVDPEAARRKHEVFGDARSEFASYLNLWAAYRRERRGGERALRRWALDHYLSVARLREWHDVHDQLHELVQGLRWRTRQQTADYRAIHQAVLAAFIDFIAEHDDGLVYRGMRESRAQLFAGTALAKKRPRWIVAAERVATERQYLRTVAQVNPRWALRVAPHLVRFEHDDPQWDPERGQVTAREVVTLFGMRIASERRIDYGRVDAKQARTIFIAEALAADAVAFEAGEPEYLAHNRAVRREVLEAEARLRKRDLFVGEGGVATFYEERLPAAVHDRAGLMSAGAGRDLQMTLRDVAARDPGDLAALGYPSELELAGQRLPLTYVFEPGAEADGITVTVPRSLLGAIRQVELEWLVPAWLHDKVVALLRALPKELRRTLVPLPDTARDALVVMRKTTGRQSLSIALAEALREVRHAEIEPSAFDERALPAHLRLRLAVVDADGRPVGAGRDVVALQRELGAPPGAAAVEAAPAGWQRTGLTRWDVGDLPPTVVVAQRPQPLSLYPALVDADGRVDLTLQPPGPAAVALHRGGVRRLLLKALPQQSALIRDRALADRALVLAYHGVADSAALVDDLLLAAAEQSFDLDPPVRREAEFAALLKRGRAQLVAEADALRTLLAEILPLQRSVRRALESAAKKEAHGSTRLEVAAQLAELVGPRMLTDTPREWRQHLPRYLRAALQRWEKRGQRNEPELAAEARAAAARLEHWRATRAPGTPWPDSVVEYRWLLEEFRVSLFAQQLGTVRSVSAKRLEQAWQKAIATA